MTIIFFILLLLAALCFLLGAFSAPIPRINLIGLGLLFWVVTLLIKAGEALHG